MENKNSNKDILKPNGEPLKTGFTVPEGYFNTIEDIVLAKLKAEALQTNENSGMPSNYFNTVEKQVFDKLNSPSKVITLKNNRSKYTAVFAIAASLLLIFTLNFKKETVIGFESLATSEIENFIDNGMVDVGTESLAYIFSEVELTDDVFSIPVTDEEVLEYLSDEDLEQLIYNN